MTGDFDFIAGLEVIASVAEQQRLHEVLARQGFQVVPANARWQFAKRQGAGRAVLLDFHTPSPVGNQGGLRVEGRRVKPPRSLGQTGIHGRENPEAVAAGLHPFSFLGEQGVMIALPNVVTLALMKLVAMRDRHRASQDASSSAEERQAEDRQARKHAEDVCRVMAMMTREESELAGNILAVVRPTPAFVAAADAFAVFFQANEHWGSQVVAPKWQVEDFQLIQNLLAIWFR